MTRPSLMPSETPDYMAEARAGALIVAAGNSDIVASFRADTGSNWTPPRSGFERMIDDASGASDDFVKAFVEWFNVNVWGSV